VIGFSHDEADFVIVLFRLMLDFVLQLTSTSQISKEALTGLSRSAWIRFAEHGAALAAKKSDRSNSVIDTIVFQAQLTWLLD
jgi:hypothetical protein